MRMGQPILSSASMWRWEALGISALGGTAAEALRRNEVETAKWGAVIDAAKIKLD
jgi:hypothetical protein